ncbi:glycosyltransferase [Lactobacillus delbrueckii subsp. bulgaricus]|nr:hypothetical protein [Lactobacillus delbrueckii subsp. bulgaricus]
MKYSFITPVYSTKPSLLKRCIDSIEKLGLEEYELIWVNDGSDNMETNDYCASLCESNDHFKYYYQDLESE